jgi:hypothetical protein
MPSKLPKGQRGVAWGSGSAATGDRTQDGLKGIKGAGTLMGGALVEEGLDAACFSAAAAPPTP